MATRKNKLPIILFYIYIEFTLKERIHIFDEEQIVKIRWNPTNLEWYKSKGYKFTKYNDIFDAKAKDLTIHNSAKINVICDYCGAEYKTQYSLITKGRKIINKDCCAHCAGKKASDVSKQKRAVKYMGLAQKICEENGYALLSNIDDYHNIFGDIRFICQKHGEQIMTINNFIRGHKCIRCSYEIRGDGLRHDVEYVKKSIESINGNIWLNPEYYQEMRIRNLKIQCSCGNTFITSFYNYLKCGVNSCFSCSSKESRNEKYIRKFLENHNIKFIQEKRFDDCRDNKPLPFDFYLPQYNLIIEYDGEQHFKDSCCWNIDITKKHDKIKNQYCKTHNIELLTQTSHLNKCYAP